MFKSIAALAGSLIILAAGAAHAQTTTAPPTEAKPAAPSASWWDTFAITGHLEAGITFNSLHPSDGNNFGNLFGDRANTVMLNQALVTAQRPLDPKATGYDFGFKLQAMYGSDARYTHFLGMFDEAINDQSQIDIVEANILFHLPWLTAGGVDLKIGQYPTLEGAEVISAPDNPLYSHSYIFNFGIPFKHTGFMTTTHVNDTLDIYAGLDTGVNTTFGCCSVDSGDNNRSVAFHGGIGLNNLFGALTILATTHIGAENPDTLAVRAACACDPNSAMRYLNDITATWTVNDKLTLITDLNYIRDDGFKADGYGVAQYATYAINDWLKVTGRAEIWRDNAGFFVAAYPGNLDFVKTEHGDPTAVVIAGTPTTYGALTVGLNIAPAVPTNPVLKGLIFRPEIRYDTSLNGTTPFGAGAYGSQFTFAGDVILKF